MLVFLVGYMACGKSTIGRKLNQRLRWPLFDTDKEIISEQKASVAEIFDNFGEEYFRQLEHTKIKELINSNIIGIISTGGGAPIWGDNMALMNHAGLTIYLYRSAESIVKRLSEYGREKRPKLRGLNDEELLETLKCGILERDHHYREARLVIEVDKLPDERVVDIIVEHLKDIKSNEQ